MKRIVLLLVALALLPQFAAAQTRISVTGAGRKYPIAVPQLCTRLGDSGAAKEIPRIIARDLQLSGYFEVINPDSYIETPGKCVNPEDTVYSDWSVIGTEGLVHGAVEEQNHTLRVALYLHDVQVQKVVLGKEYVGEDSRAKDIAHKFANEIVKFFTGEEGVFGSQIVFSGKVGRFKELFVMDMDGSNVRQLTNDRGLAITASWSQGGDNALYTSYRDRVPDVYLLDAASRRLRRVTRGADLELGAKYTKDGRNMVLSRSNGHESDIVLMDLNGNMIRRLTGSPGEIAVSPDYSPDGSQIAFCSNRAGGPQIYTMSSDGSGVKRISFVSSSYCTSPVWSPKGDRIAFVCRAEGRFQIFVTDTDGGNALQLTSLGDNEDPDWSPDGRYIVFATTFGRGETFNLALMRSDGSNIMQLTSSRGGDTEPSCGPVPR